MNVLRIFFISLLWLSVNGETWCPMLFQRYSESHTYCLPPNPTCRIQRNKVKISDRELILREHNVCRSRVASGLETIYSMPKGSDMLEMVWDDELAYLAQKHSEQCVFQHDCNECRRVQNFDVGQNLYERTVYPEPLKPDWVAAVKSWYDEVKDFDKGQIDSFEDGEGPPQTGHLTQLIWAHSWRVGCGYTMYKRGISYVELYTCNYGPAGNIKNERIYKKGNPYTDCPVNSCYGKSCSTQSYPGLCQIVGDKAPLYKSPEECIFSCSFNNEADCATKTTSGVDKSKIYKTLSGSYIGIVLEGGESTTINFTTPFKGKEAMCLVSYYRKGPQVAGQESANTALQILRVPKINFTFKPELQINSVDFIKISITLHWNMTTMLSIKFSVPHGKPSQYLEMKDIKVTEGQC